MVLSGSLRHRFGRVALIVSLVVCTAALLALQPLAAPVDLGNGVQIKIPGGFNPRAGLPDRRLMAALAPSNSYDPNRTEDKYAEFKKAIPVANPELPWKDVGPLGVDNPPGYMGSTEQFGRIAGMGTALAADTNDPTGNTVFFGNMGGLWKSTDGGTNWKNLSDGKLTSAGVGAIGLNPNRPQDIYVGTGISYLTISGEAYGTGFYVSHDGGQTFNRPSPNTSGWGTNVIRVSPTGVVYVGTNHGLYVSTDHGDTLSLVQLPTLADHSGTASGPYANWITDVAIRPGHPNEVTVAVGFPQGKVKLADGSIAAPGNGLYRSMAGGAAGTFKALDVSGLTNPESSADPIGRITLQYSPIAGGDAILWALLSDAGLTNSLGFTGLPAPLDNPTASTLNGLYRSGDDGASWTLKEMPTTLLAAPNSTLTPSANPVLGYAPGVQADYEIPLALDPNIPDQVYSGLEEAYQTLANAGPGPGPAATTVIERYADICGFYLFTTNVTNGLACPTGTPIYGGYTTHPDQHAMVVVKTGTGSRIYSANDGGVFRQDSHAVGLGQGFDNNSWTDLNHMASLEPWRVAMLPDGEILQALQDNGASINGADRRGVEFGIGDGVYVFPTPNSDIFYFSVPGAGLFVTKDHGHNFTEMQPSLNGVGFLSPIAIDPTDPNHIVAAAQNIEETLKGANTMVLSNPVTGQVIRTDWTQSYNAGTAYGGLAWTATALDVRGAVAYAGMCVTCRTVEEQFDKVHAGIMTNVKTGCTPAKGSSACWHTATGKGLPQGYLSSLVIDPLDTKTIYVSVLERQFVGYPANKAPGRVFVSHDGGESFTDLTGNLPHGSIWKLVLRNNIVVAATDTGVFASKAGSLAWDRLGSGLPATQVRDAFIDPTGRYLLVSAYGRGTWQLDFGSAGTGSNNPTRPPTGGVQGTSTGLPGTLAALPQRIPDFPGAVALLILLGLMGLTAWPFLKRSPKQER
jgi:hypothetical protein